MTSRLSFTALACLWFSTIPARADLCQAAASLARVYDSALALELETGEMRDEAAIELLALFIPDVRPSEIADELSENDIPTDANRLKSVFDAAANRARDHLSGVQHEPLTDDSDDAAELDWLADLILGTNCMGDWNGLRPLPSAEDQKSLSEKAVEQAASRLTELAIVAGCVLMVLAFRAIRRTRLYRAGELRTQPRTAVSLDATVRPMGAAETVPLKIVDLSIGGAKVAWPAPPDTGTRLLVDIGSLTLEGSIIWRNDFYAGLLFDDYLGKEQLENLIRISVERPDGK